VSALSAASAAPQPAAPAATAAAPAATEGGETAAATVLAAASLPVDFRALIANLTLLELPVADAGAVSDAAAPAVEGPPPRAADASGQAETDTDTDSTACSDLQAAIAAMSTLPWPATCAVSLPSAAAATAVAERGARAAPATSSAIAAAVNTVASGDSAVLAARGQSGASAPAADQSTPADAAPLTLLPQGGQLSDSDSRTDRDRTSSAGGQRPGTDAPAGQAIAELRASFSAVMAANTISARVAHTVAVPVHDARWPAAVASEVRWCAQAGVQSATLKVVPDNLGPIELTVDVKDNKVNVSFTASQVETRNALEDSLPRLRELLAGSGLTLGQANVQQEARRDSQLATLTPRPTDEAAAAAESPVRRVGIGLVDEYA